MILIVKHRFALKSCNRLAKRLLPPETNMADRQEIMRSSQCSAVMAQIALHHCHNLTTSQPHIYHLLPAVSDDIHYRRLKSDKIDTLFKTKILKIIPRRASRTSVKPLQGSTPRAVTTIKP